jgi:hypothetical protein
MRINHSRNRTQDWPRGPWPHLWFKILDLARVAAPLDLGALRKERTDWKDGLGIREVPKEGFVGKHHRSSEDQDGGGLAPEFPGREGLGGPDRRSAVTAAAKGAAGQELQCLCHGQE